MTEMLEGGVISPYKFIKVTVKYSLLWTPLGQENVSPLERHVLISEVDLYTKVYYWDRSD